MSRKSVYKAGLYAIIGAVLAVLLAMNVTRSYKMLDVTVLAGVLLLALWIIGFAIMGNWPKKENRQSGSRNRE